MQTSGIVKKFQEICKKNKIDALLLSDVNTIFYVSGFGGFSSDEREGYALVTSEKIYIFASALHITAVTRNHYIERIEMTSQTPFRQALVTVCTKNNIKRLGFEPHDLTVAEFIAFKKLKTFQLVPVDLHHLREIKDAEEIEMIKKACQLGDKAFGHILGCIKPGQTEKEIASEIEIFFKKHLADTSFPSIVAFGDHSAIPHHNPTDRVLKKQEIIKLDFGCRLNKYCSDMTRTIFLGKPTDEQKKVYETVKLAQEKSFEYAGTKGKIEASQIDQKARDYVMSQGYADFPHASHGIGLEVHEAPSLSPRSKTIIENGMVFSIEPGIYLSGKFGVRIEDIVVRTKDDIDILTTSPRQLISL